MLKRILLLTATFLSTSSLAFANGTTSSSTTAVTETSHHNYYNYTGSFNAAPYIGFSVGADNLPFTQTTDTSTFNFGSRGAVANIFGGFGGMISDTTYLGAEIFANISSTEVKAIDVDEVGYARLKKNASYGISLIPGVMITDSTLLFGRLGVVNTRFQYKVYAQGDSETSNKTVTGGQLGLGLQTSVSENVDVRAEYTYTTYRTFNAVGSRINASDDQVALGVIYRFQ